MHTRSAHHNRAHDQIYYKCSAVWLILMTNTYTATYYVCGVRTRMRRRPATCDGNLCSACCGGLKRRHTACSLTHACTRTRQGCRCRFVGAGGTRKFRPAVDVHCLRVHVHALPRCSCIRGSMHRIRASVGHGLTDFPPHRNAVMCQKFVRRAHIHMCTQTYVHIRSQGALKRRKCALEPAPHRIAP